MMSKLLKIARHGPLPQQNLSAALMNLVFLLIADAPNIIIIIINNSCVCENFVLFRIYLFVRAHFSGKTLSTVWGGAEIFLDVKSSQKYLRSLAGKKNLPEMTNQRLGKNGYVTKKTVHVVSYIRCQDMVQEELQRLARKGRSSTHETR